MPLYSARPPLTPPRTLSERLRCSCGRAGDAGGGAEGAHGGGSKGGGAGGTGGGGGVLAARLPGGGRGGRGGGADVMALSLPIGRPANHQGTPPSDPGSPTSARPG